MDPQQFICCFSLIEAKSFQIYIISLILPSYFHSQIIYSDDFIFSTKQRTAAETVGNLLPFPIPPHLSDLCTFLQLPS